MIAVYGSAAGICLVSVALGAAVCVRHGWSWLSPAVGFAAALALAYLGGRLPGHGATAAAILALATVGALLALRGRVDLRAVAQGALPAAGVLAATAVPFVVNRRLGVLGESMNDDPAIHLVWADALRSAADAAPLDSHGYPLGPHALMAAFAEGLGTQVDATFVGLMLAVQVLIALTALAALDHLQPRLRVLGAILVGLPYLVAAYFAQGSYKEPLMGLLALGMALTLRDAARGRIDRWRAALALALLSAASLYVFGYGGMAFPLAIVGAVGIALLAVHRRRLGAVMEQAVRPAALGVGVVAVLSLPEISRMVSFHDSSTARSTRNPDFMGNFPGAISPSEVFGVWPSFDFRFQPVWDPLAWKASVVLAGIATVGGALWWLVRRDLAVPVGAGAAVLLWVWADHQTTPYYAAKPLVAASPLVALLGLGGLLSAAPRRRAARLAWACAAGVVVVLSLESSLLALRGASARPADHADDLARLRPLVESSDTLFVGRDHFAPWDLHGARVSSFTDNTIGLAEKLTPRPGKTGGHGGVDLDSIDPALLRRYRFVVASRSAYGSTPPSAWRVRRRTRWWVLYEREGQEEPRHVLSEGDAPGAILQCHGRRAGGEAVVRPAPVIAGGVDWHVSGGPPGGGTPANLSPGGALETTLVAPRGRFELALQYHSPTRLEISTAGLEAGLPPHLGDETAYWRVGTVAPGGGRRTVSVRMPYPRRFAPSAGARLGALTATPLAPAPRRVPLRRACGRYVDWYVSR